MSIEEQLKDHEQRLQAIESKIAKWEKEQQEFTEKIRADMENDG